MSAKKENFKLASIGYENQDSIDAAEIDDEKYDDSAKPNNTDSVYVADEDDEALSDLED